MRTTIDAAGRVVIPKSLRDAAGLDPGAEIEVGYREGRIEIEPVTVPMHLAVGDGGPTIEADGELPPLTADDVRDTLERARR